MQVCCSDLVQQSEDIHMNVNGRKTKEMLIGPLAKNPPPPLSLNGTLVDRVSSFKLLGVHISTDLKWKEHVQVIASKAASRLHFLKQLKRAGAPTRDLLHFYTTVVRPILEYACPVWHSGLTNAQSDALESMQKRAMRIIYSEGTSFDYQFRLIIAGIDTLQDRREILAERFVQSSRFAEQLTSSSSAT